MERVNDIWLVAQLLWRIVNSKMLCYHLTVLHVGGWIHSPINNQQALVQYQLYTGFRSIGCSDPPTSHGNANVNGDMETGDLSDDIEWSILQEEGTAEILADNVLHSWFGLQVNHFIALDVLTTMCGVAEGLPDLQVLLLKMKYLATDGIPLEPWKDMVTRLCAPHNLKANCIKDLL